VLVPAVLLVVAAVLVLTGVALLSVPWALIVAGLGLGAVAWLADLDNLRRKGGDVP
jgi:hypothetical protein